MDIKELVLIFSSRMFKNNNMYVIFVLLIITNDKWIYMSFLFVFFGYLSLILILLFNINLLVIIQKQIIRDLNLIIVIFFNIFEYFLNLIRICWTCKNVSHSLFKNFECYSYIFRILFVYVESTKHVLYHYSIFLNIIRIYYESFSYKLNMQKGVISLYNIF